MKKNILCSDAENNVLCSICQNAIKSEEICSECSSKLLQLNNYLKLHGYSKKLTVKTLVLLQEVLQKKDIFPTLFKIDFYPILLQLPTDNDFTENTVISEQENLKKHHHVRSKGEKAVEDFLKNINLPYYTQYNTLKCINPITGKQLPYDFEIPNFKIIIEVQGKQHYEPVPYFHNTTNMNYQIFKDIIKRQYAIQNGYKFLCIFPEDFDNNIFKQKIMKAIISSAKRPK